jgi:hypothetical protein
MSTIGDKRRKLEHARREPTKHPQGWEPGVEWNGKTGAITSTPTTERPDWSALMEKWSLDPDVVEVLDDTVQMRSWDAFPGQGLPPVTMFYYRASLKIKGSQDGPDIDELLAVVNRRKAPKLPKGDGCGAFAVFPADLQAGKQGTETMVDMYKASVETKVQDLRYLLRSKEPIDRILLAFMGDLVENCAGFYPQMTFTVEMDMREQRRLTRSLVLYTIDAFRPFGLPMVVPTLPGNHGENRNEAGKSFTTFGDNSDIEVVETVAEACSQNPGAYGHVSFVIPEQELSMSLDVAGVIVGLAHGHQAGKGVNPMALIEKWWTGQIKGQRPVGDAQLLITAHNHQPWIYTVGPRFMLGCPTVDAGSPWFEEAYGLATRSGLLSMVIGKHLRHGFDHWRVT